MIDKINAWVGKNISWLSFALVLLIAFNVLMRYLFSNSKIWADELAWHFFALLFLLGSAYAYQNDKHVRVDVFYQNFSLKTKAIINLLGTIFFLFPFCIIVIYTSFNYAQNSFLILESSDQPGGLPARYLIKFSITIGFFFLMLQGVSVIIKSLKTLFSTLKR